MDACLRWGWRGGHRAAGDSLSKQRKVKGWEEISAMLLPRQHRLLLCKDGACVCTTEQDAAARRLHYKSSPLCVMLCEKCGKT